MCVVAGCAPCRVTQLTLGVTLQRSAAPPFPGGPCVPPGAPYQNTLGAVPQDPLTLKLRLDTNDAKASSVSSRRYALKVPAAHFMWGYCKLIAESYAAKTMGRTSNYLDRRPLPRHGGGERGCEAERRQWRMQRGGAPAAVEKNEQASSAKIFSGTARRRGQMRPRLPLKRICAQYGFGFFAPEKSKSVSSTAKRQRGLQRGKLGSPLPGFASFCRSKRKAPAASGANYAFAKGPATPKATTNWPPAAGDYRP